MRIALPLILMACTPATPEPRDAGTAAVSATPEPTERELQRAYWQLRTDAELDAALETACAASQDHDRPLLLTFSADWCPDCKRVYALSRQDPLREELGRWEGLVIHPGRFDRHQPLLAAFGVTRIVTWVAIRPDDCRLPAPSWPRLRAATFEPATGEARTAEQLAQWLAEARQSGP